MKKNKTTKFFLLTICILLSTVVLFTSCEVKNSLSFNLTDEFFTLKVTGDVEEELTISGYGEFKTQNVKIKDVNYKGIELSDLLEKAGAKSGSVILSGYDGVMAEISIDDVDENCFLSITEKGWQFHSENLPKQTRIKNLEMIVIKKEQILENDRCFRTIYNDVGKTYSFGELFLKDKMQLTVLEGSPIFNGKTANALSKRQVIPLQTFFNEMAQGEFVSVVGYFENGVEKTLDKGGYVQWRGNAVDYIGADKVTRIENLVGVWFDPPQSISDISDFVLKKLTKEKVMLIELDGVGFYSLVQNKEFMDKHSIEKMRTVFPSISNVALATILTGKQPIDSGIVARKDREVKCEDVFEKVRALGKNAVMIEGDAKLISLSIDQILNVDKNGDGTNDDEVFECVQNNLDKDFVFVHFHGYDDVAHTFSQSSKNAKDKLQELLNYVSALAKEFDGSVIVTADHGHRDTPNLEKKGSHGEFLFQDMTVPFVIIQ